MIADEPRGDAAGPAEEWDDRCEQELAAGERLLRDDLLALLAPPEHLTSRTHTDVRAALAADSPLTAAFDLVGLGWQTLRLLTNREDRS